MLKAARTSVSIIFFLNGLLVSNWIARIPAVQQDLRLDVRTLGIALLGASGGALVAMSQVSRVIARFGSAPVTRWSAIAFCIALPLPALARGAVSLTALLFVYGACNGAMEVAMNVQAVDVERAYRRPIMVGFHALFSFGGMMGAALGGVAASAGLAPFYHLILVGGFIAVACMVASSRLLRVEKEPESAHLPGARSLWPLAGLAAIAFCILLGEGSIADWGAVYLNQYTSQAAAALGYSAFSLTMACGRLAGDWLRSRIGSVMLVRAGSALAAAGLGAALAFGGTAAAFLGFACAGAGWAAIFPIATSAAGAKMGSQPEAGVAAVSATGYFAFLIGPPLIGLLAHESSLRFALFLVVAGSAVTTAMAGAVREADHS